jgi:iron complex outermembrane receptor protein
MKCAKKPIVLAVALALPAMYQTAIAQSNNASAAPVMKEVVIHASKINGVDAAGARLDASSIAPMRASTSDAASLLQDTPGVSLYSAGGVSSLPAIHGLADDRIRIKVDGMDLISACANHMNSPLSYIDPTNTSNIRVFAGISPVSAGGDSIAGSIIINSIAPEFAKAGEGTLFKGEAGTFYRSNNNAKGANLSATLANENLSIRFSGSTAQADNYKAGGDFKRARAAFTGGPYLAGDVVGSSAYKAENQSIAIALRNENHLLRLNLGFQNIPNQGFPNQRMDMTGNDSQQINLSYTGQYTWGSLEARVYNENTKHDMNFGPDKQFWYGTAPGMPMKTEGKNTGALVKAAILLSERDTLTLGGDYQKYRLNDWWPASGTGAMMAPNIFLNINDGQRDRVDVFAEWDARWNPQWQSQLGIRSSTVTMNTGTVQGYSTMMYPAASFAAFNNADRSKTDNNIDLAAMARYTPDTGQTYEAALARKTRSPSLYERYVWSTNNTMVMNMNNWVGDGNGYVGNINLKPEVANTLSATASWHDADKKSWGLSVTPYYTHVENYIDAVSCTSIGKTCPARTDGFANLSLANQTARLYGADVAGRLPLGSAGGFGDFTATGVLNYVNGKNLTTGGNLYNIMPLNMKLAFVQKLGSWTNTLESVFVDAKKDVEAVRKELRTPGYSLFNLRSSYEWKQVRLDVGIDNMLNKFYALPLGGAYIGQGATMGTGVAYGTSVAGMGRSVYTGLNIKF